MVAYYIALNLVIVASLLVVFQGGMLVEFLFQRQCEYWDDRVASAETLAGQDDPKSAARSLETTIEKIPFPSRWSPLGKTRMRAQQLLGAIYADLGQPADSVRVFDKLLEEDPAALRERHRATRGGSDI